jgi:pimeloyl-ACP methyl ester carboxylesterase
MTVTRTLAIHDGDATVHGDLTVPDGACGRVLFAHGSGSSRFSPRNRRVAAGLVDAGFATLLVDLLTEQEDRADRLDGRHRFDIALLARRLSAAMAESARDTSVGHLPLGLFGASTGAAAALVAAADHPDSVRAVVSRGGRPDLAGDALGRVRCPTLLIVGARDEIVVDLNERTARRLGEIAKVAVVPAATHLFEEPGALARVIVLARDWFLEHLAGISTGRPSTGHESTSR